MLIFYKNYKIQNKKNKKSKTKKIIKWKKKTISNKINQNKELKMY